MNLIVVAAVLAPLAAGAALWRQHRYSRDRRYADLVAARHGAGDSPSIGLAAETTLADPGAMASAFSAQRLLRVRPFVSQQAFEKLREEALAGLERTDPGYVPGHKKGRTLSYEQILRHAPHLLGFYQSRAVRSWLSAITGADMKPTPVQDQSSLSVLCYRDAGDHIGWHYDLNFYRGRHFTVLLMLVNRAAGGGLSHARLERQHPDGRIELLDMPENTLVAFEGARVRHRVTPTAHGDLRLVLSMTYCDDPRIHPVKEAARRVKDTAFYGPRALWD
jgi:hypothetical protein